MKIAFLLAVMASVAVGSLLILRTYRSTWHGGMWGAGSWIVDGPKGENSPEELPPEAAALAREGDRVSCTEVWNLDLGIRYSTFRIGTAGEIRTGAARFYAVMAALVLAPLVLWFVALGVTAALRRR